MHGLRRGDRRVRIAHRRRRDHAAFQHQRRLDPEERRLPQHEVGELARLHRTDDVRDAVGNRRVDRVLGDVALHAQVVVACRIARQRAALRLHLVRRLPGADDHLADATHRLRIRRQHRERAEVVQDVLGRDGLAADARLGERDVLGDRRVEMVADHQHVEMLVDRVDRVGARRIGRRRQHVRRAGRLDDVRGVAAARALGVIGVDRASGDRRERGLDEARFVERVGVDRDLDVEFVGDAQRGIDRRRRRAPVFVQLESDRAGLDLLAQCGRRLALPLPRKPRFIA